MNKLRLFLIGLFLLLAVHNIIGNNCFKLRQVASRTTEMSCYFLQSDSIALTDIGVISGFAISGEVRKTSPEYVIRVILTDIDGNEYLVMESYEEINSDSIFTVNGFCEETALLSGITPVNLKVFLKDASFQLTRMSFSSSLNRDVSKAEIDNARKNIKRSQTETIISKINEYNRSHKRLWVAGETSLSVLDYATKKRLLGLNDGISSEGWEYYVDGIFEIGHTNQSNRDGTTLYVPDFDWRDRHGINWMTPVQFQGASNFCTAFAALSCTEAVANLYFNRKLDLNLSEQEIASCSDNHPHYLIESISPYMVFQYLQNHGVCDEIVYPFEPLSEVVPCKTDTLHPNENIRINGNAWLLSNDSIIKRNLISYGPLFTVFYTNYPTSHAISLVGYHKIRVGDTICYVGGTNLNPHEWLIVNEEDDELIGQTYWVFKDHYPHAGYINSSYRYILFHQGISSCVDLAIRIETPIFSINYSNDDIVWEDRDGDGYFNWGIGSRPSSVPEWVPYIRDGDDSDNSKGTLDQYGYCADLAANIADTLLYDRDGSLRDHIEQSIKIARGATVVIESNISCLGYSSITIDENSTLIIDGYKLRNADIHMKPQSHLIIRNGGEIYLKRYESFDVPLGATVDISEGAIFNRPY